MAGRILTAVMSAGLLGALTTTPASSQEIFGRWVVESGKAVIEILPCGQQACGRLAWLKNPLDDTGQPKRDVMNPEPENQSRLLCGLPLVEGLNPQGDGMWAEGSIYSTRDGKTYGLDVAPIDENSLAVRGYVGLTLFGSSQTWRRDQEQRTCKDSLATE
ncbi:MAG: DUF2147 domain-containing protein [Pseudomonadota bacterium]